ncbi:MAG: indole-3-glycerol phosphate synthase TrpC [Candidatus Eisenbacteria bacterium]
MSLLQRIVQSRRAEVLALRARLPIASLESASLWRDDRRPFGAALERPAPGEPLRFLAEVKRASPSAGAIRPGADPAGIAKGYAEAGAAAISILTETKHFDGDPAFLARAREAVALPLLMKDFFVDDWQVAWARSLGADAILLIVAGTDQALLRDLFAAARDLGLETLVEVHDERELESAVSLGARVVGVNRRNLEDFTIDRSLGARLLPLLPAGCVKVAESGVRTRDDVTAIEREGFDAVLVGETLMRDPSPGDALRRLRGAEEAGR